VQPTSKKPHPSLVANRLRLKCGSKAVARCLVIGVGSQETCAVALSGPKNDGQAPMSALQSFANTYPTGQIAAITRGSEQDS
jgi:hypothetical protein